MKSPAGTDTETWVQTSGAGCGYGHRQRKRGTGVLAGKRERLDPLSCRTETCFVRLKGLEHHSQIPFSHSL